MLNHERRGTKGFAENYELDDDVWSAVRENDANQIYALSRQRAEMNTTRGADTIDFKKGDSPLHYAARLGHMDAVKALIECGARPLMLNAYGEKPLDCLPNNASSELKAYLAGATQNQRKNPVNYPPLKTHSGNEGRREALAIQNQTRLGLALDRHEQSINSLSTRITTLEAKLQQALSLLEIARSGNTSYVGMIEQARIVGTLQPSIVQSI